VDKSVKFLCLKTDVWLLFGRVFESRAVQVPPFFWKVGWGAAAHLHLKILYMYENSMFFLPLKKGHLQHGIIKDLWGILS